MPGANTDPAVAMTTMPNDTSVTLPASGTSDDTPRSTPTDPHPPVSIPMAVLDPSTVVYEHPHAKAPVLTGRLALSAVVYAMRYTPGVARYIWADGGMFALRDAELPEDATHLPLVPPTKAQEATASTNPVNVDDFLRVAPPPAGTGAVFRFPTIRDYHEKYRSGATTPTAVIDAILASIADTQRATDAHPDMKTFVVIDEAHARAQAAASTARWAAGHPISILDGVPVAIKDEMDVAGLRYAMYGTEFLNEGKGASPDDSECVARLRACGAIVVGKTSMAELGIETLGANPNPRTGVSRNPYNPDRHTGGSSGGSAAAVASGIVPLAVGADGGGSVRIPAAFCGVWGLKPTWGRISSAPSFNLDPSTGHIGPLGASLEDVAIAYAVMAGADKKAPYSEFQPRPALPLYLGVAQRKAPLRIGVYHEYFNDASEGMVTACQAALDHLVKAHGAQIVNIAIPHLALARVAQTMTISSEIFNLVRTYKGGKHIHDVSLPTQVIMEAQQNCTLDDYLRAQRLRTRMIAHIKALFDHRVDLIALPMTGIVAPPIHPAAHVAGISDVPSTVEIMKYAFLSNLTGNPALTCPVGVDKEGTPVGLQLIAPWWAEDELLAAGKLVEEVVVANRTQPKVYYPVLL
ncbi:hypothetical protein GGF31_000250 [Allomyces arbusculus]|nr:hypothetical protein GGF31_000250 [Allomyces arbusculus]